METEDQLSADGKTQPQQINTEGGTAILGNVNTGGDFVGRDKVIHNNTFSDSSVNIEIAPGGNGTFHFENHPTPVNSSDQHSSHQSPSVEKLFSVATRLHLFGKLGEALQIYKQVKAIEPNYPRIDAEILSVEFEIKTGRQKGYVNSWGEVLSNQIVRIRGSGGVGKTALFHFVGHGLVEDRKVDGWTDFAEFADLFRLLRTPSNRVLSKQVDFISKYTISGYNWHRRRFLLLIWASSWI